MKNQYFGDINDYRKYGLLRALQSVGGGSLLVAWMLTPDDGSRDGGLRSYLEDSDRWATYDPELFAGLRGLLHSARRPAVSLIEASGLLPRAAFYSEVVPEGRRERDAWRDGLLRAASGVDLVFLDPDNGIEVPSKPVGRKGSSKYVTWSEIQALWDSGSSLLIYQHFRREARDAFARRLLAELQQRTGARYTEAFRTPHVLYLLAAQERHERRFREVVPLLSQRWGGQLGPSDPRLPPLTRPAHQAVQGQHLDPSRATFELSTSCGDRMVTQRDEDPDRHRPGTPSVAGQDPDAPFVYFLARVTHRAIRLRLKQSGFLVSPEELLYRPQPS